MQDFRNLVVWQKAHALTLAIYRYSGEFPRDELYGLTSQIRRTGTSVAANIAEGCGRNGRADFARFLQISFGSASELEYHLILARDLGMLRMDEYETLTKDAVEVKKMLTALIQKLKTEN